MMTVGNDIISGLKDALDHANGEQRKVRETIVHVPQDVDVRAIRERLQMSQEEFSIRFGFSVGTVRHWEQGRRQPEGPARAYLKVIAHAPDTVENALSA